MKNVNQAFGVLLIAFGLLMAPSLAHAACSNPAGVEGEQIYNDDHNVMQYCDGTDWTAMRAGGASGSSGSCPNGFTKIEASSNSLGCIQNDEANSGAGMNFANAADHCFITHGGRLPSASEWNIAIANYTLNDETDDLELLDDGSTGSRVMRADGVNSFDSTNFTTSSAFRCFIPASGGGSGDGSDTLADLTCTDGQVAKWNNAGTAWECAADADTSDNLGAGGTTAGTLYTTDGKVGRDSTDYIGFGNGFGLDVWVMNGNGEYTISSAAISPTNATGGATLGTAGDRWSGAFHDGTVDVRTGSTSAFYGQADATSGFAVALNGLAKSTSGRGVIGTADATTGATFGVYGTVNSTTGIGVYGEVAATTGANYGVYGTTNSASGSGAYFTNTTGTSAAALILGQGVLNMNSNNIINAGNVTATAYFHSSDERLKDNIKTVSGLDLISKMRGVTYDWKSDGSASGGVIAQEIEAVMPSAVKTDDKGMKSVDYDQLIAPLIEAVKELKAENDALKQRVEKLENAE